VRWSFPWGSIITRKRIPEPEKIVSPRIIGLVHSGVVLGGSQERIMLRHPQVVDVHRGDVTAETTYMGFEHHLPVRGELEVGGGGKDDPLVADVRHHQTVPHHIGDDRSLLHLLSRVLRVTACPDHDGAVRTVVGTLFDLDAGHLGEDHSLRQLEPVVVESRVWRRTRILPRRSIELEEVVDGVPIGILSVDANLHDHGRDGSRPGETHHQVCVAVLLDGGCVRCGDRFQALVAVSHLRRFDDLTFNVYEHDVTHRELIRVPERFFGRSESGDASTPGNDDLFFRLRVVAC
jgi:hypothetical protein